MFNLHPKNADMQSRMPMHQVAEKFNADNEHYTLAEIPTGQLIIRVSEKNIQSVAKAVKTVTKLAMPRTLQSESNANYSLFWIAPDEFLLVVPEKTEADIEAKIRKAADGHFAIVDVTCGQSSLQLSGERAELILKKSTVYDVHLSNFPIGKVVTTKFAKSQIIMCRTAEDSFQLIVRRSFSDYIWQWIVDAGSRA